jgi:hypothetical protein
MIVTCLSMYAILPACFLPAALSATFCYSLGQLPWLRLAVPMKLWLLLDPAATPAPGLPRGSLLSVATYTLACHAACGLPSCMMSARAADATPIAWYAAYLPLSFLVVACGSHAVCYEAVIASCFVVPWPAVQLPAPSAAFCHVLSRGS